MNIVSRQLIRIARILQASEFNFLNNKDFGPQNVIIVAKSDVYAHQLTDDDVDNIVNAESKEGKYDESKVKKGNWVCTAKVGKDAGEFWIVDATKFGKNYDDSSPIDNERLNKTTWGVEFEFEHYGAKGDATFECFRLPTNMKPTTWQGNKFNPGSYVFIDKGSCDIWERTDKFMQQQYHKVGEGQKPGNKVFEQYDQIIGGND